MTQTETLSLAELAQARHNAYVMLGQVYLEGVSAETLPYLSDIINTKRIDADEAAAEHHQLFSFDVFPYASIYLDASGLMGGDITSRVQQLYTDAGFRVMDDADHIGHELHFLAYLSGAEADAWADNLPAIALRMQVLQKEFFENHHLHWLVALMVTIQSQENAVYSAIAQLTLRLVSEHYVALPAKSITNFELPIVSLVLEDEQTTLKDIADHLATPVAAGCWIGRREITKLGRQYELPRGFGGRRQMFGNLLRSAAHFDSAAHIFGELETFFEARQGNYAGVSAEFPPLSPFAEPWLDVVSVSAETLNSMQAAIKATNAS